MATPCDGLPAHRGPASGCLPLHGAGAAVDPDTGDVRDAAVGQRLAAVVRDVIDLTRRLRR